MYVNIYCCKKTNRVWIYDDKAGLIKSELDPYYYGYKRSAHGSYVSIYGDKLERVKTDAWTHNDNLFESDVPIETRVLIDVYGESDDVSEGKKVMILDIEVSTEGGFPNIKTADKEITAISIYDQAADAYYTFILDKKCVVKNSQNKNVWIYSFADEESLLKSFIKKYKAICPTIITGWNIDFFDIPYIIHRMQKLFGENAAKVLSPIGIVTFNKFQGKYKIGCVACLDYILLYKQYSGAQEPNYRLDSIGKKHVGMGKIEFQGSLDKLFETDINKFIEYNLNDVKIVDALDRKLQFIDLARSICHVGHVSYEDFHVSSRFLEGAILTHLKKNGMVAPNKPVGGREMYEQKLEDDEEGFSGAYVKIPVPGKYEWIFDLDLTSLYPSIIMSLNISTETKVAVVSNWDSEKFVKNELTNITFREEYQLSDMTIEDFKKYLVKNNYSISSNGVIYKQYKTKIGSDGSTIEAQEAGIIPAILDKWFAERTEYRKLAKKFGTEGDDEKYVFYNRRQHVQKILLNSIYGCLGLPSWRFFDVDNAAATTTTGVTIIKTTEKLINQYYNKQMGTTDVDHVITMDTDSCFVSALALIKKTTNIDVTDNVAMSTKIIDVASNVQDYINAAYDVMSKRMFGITNHRFHIKQEVIAKTGIFLAKKRYALWIINDNGVPKDELKITGIDVVRTSFPTAFKQITKEVINDILQGKNKEYLNKKILDFKKTIKTVDVVDIAKNTAVKELEKFEKKSRQPFGPSPNGTPAHALAVIAHNDFLKKHGLNKKYEPIQASQKIKWLYLKQNEFGIEKIAFKGDDEDCPELMEFIGKYIDRDRMYDQELLGKLKQFYEALHWDMPTQNDAKASKFFDF